MSGFFIALAIIVLGAIAVLAAVRLWPKGNPLSAAERSELGAGPKPVLQKHAIVASVGAQTYYDDDTIRLSVVAIFIGGMLAYALVVPVSLLGMRSKGTLDELDRKVLAQAPSFQSAAMLITYAAWSIYLTETFRGEGGIPPVYLFLVFGNLVLVNLLAHAGGILAGYWISTRHA